MEYLGIDIGGTKCSVVRGNDQGEIVEKVTAPTSTVNETIQWIISSAEKLKGKSVSAGISCGGPLNAELGIIQSPPNLPGWDNIEIVKTLEERLHIPAYLCNDANACAVAEWQFGAGRGCKNMVFFTFGTGLGAGLILDGKLYSGTNNMAGEAGHIRLAEHGPVGYGKAGSFEGFCSGGGIKQLGITYATEKFQMGKKVSFCEGLADLDNITAKKIAECANKGYADAIEVFCTCGIMLGKGLSIIIDILSPEKIVLGSIFERCEHLLREPMEEVLKKECLFNSYNACQIVPAQLGDNIGDYAAIAVAKISRKESV